MARHKKVIIKNPDKLQEFLLTEKLPLVVIFALGSWGAVAKSILKANACNWAILDRGPVTLKVIIFDSPYQAFLVKYNWRGYTNKEIVIAKNKRQMLTKLAARLAKTFGFSPYYIRQNLQYSVVNVTNKERGII